MVPVGRHLGGVPSENRERLHHTLLVGAGSQTRVTLSGNAHRELRVGQIHDVVAPDLPEDSLLLHPVDTPRAMVRVDHEIPLGERLSPDLLRRPFLRSGSFRPGHTHSISPVLSRLRCRSRLRRMALARAWPTPSTSSRSSSVASSSSLSVPNSSMSFSATLPGRRGTRTSCL